jgi:hypothetical protein
LVGHDAMDIDDPLDLKATAALLKADPETISKFARTGELAGTQIGKGWLFLREDVISFLRDRIAKDTAERRKKQGPACPAAVLVKKPGHSNRTVLPSLPTCNDMHLKQFEPAFQSILGQD